MSLPNYVFFRGRVVPYSDVKFGVLTHALNYGTAVFGGLRAYWNADEKQLFVFRPNDHFRRFLQSAKLMCMELPVSGEELLKGLIDLIRAEGHKEDLYIRPLAFDADEIIGVRLHDLHSEVSIVVIPYGTYNKNEEDMHVTISSWRRVDDNTIPARGKIAGAYVNSAFAKTDAHRAGFDDAIVLNADGHISEGSAANFFLLRNGVFATPPITDNVLEPTKRSSVGLAPRSAPSRASIIVLSVQVNSGRPPPVFGAFSLTSSAGASPSTEIGVARFTNRNRRPPRRNVRAYRWNKE